jgi:hypothetical protein
LIAAEDARQALGFDAVLLDGPQFPALVYVAGED